MRVLVIGGTGTLGKALVARFLKRSDHVVVMSRDEEKHYWMQEEYRGVDHIEFKIGDIRNFADVCAAMKHAHIVVNCAAIKQVPLSEANPMQAVLTNVVGTANIVRAIQEHDYPVQNVVSISSDKACNAISAMGMSKALGEKVVIAASRTLLKTRFIILRCANFNSSNGSVRELFRLQVEHGGPVTVTHSDMVRYFVDVETVCDMLFEALDHAKTGEIYVTPAEQVRIMDIATQSIGDRDIAIEFIGVRPGEKLAEELVSQHEFKRCVARGAYTVIEPGG